MGSAGCCSGPSATPVSTDDGFSEHSAHESGKTVLMLGTGGSGKTTLVKALKQAYGMEETARETAETVYTIRISMIRYMRKLVTASQDLQSEDPIKYRDCEIDTADEKVGEACDTLKELPSETMTSSESLLEWSSAMRTLWVLPAIKATFAKRQKLFAYPENMDYFFDQIDTVFADGYRPSQSDILHCSVPSCGMVEKTFAKEASAIKIVDMGGRRNERKNWPMKFSNVYGVVYVVSLTDYQAVLLEDEGRNAMHEALEVFASVASFDALEHAPLLVILNKSDLFKKALMETSMEECFSSDVGWTVENEQWTGPDYSGDNIDQVYHRALDFITNAFERRKGNRASITFRTISALDSSKVEGIFDEVSKQIAHVKIPAVKKE